MVLRDKPHIFYRNGYWYVDMCFDWRYKIGCPPYNSLEECYTFINNYRKGIHERSRTIPQHLIDAAKALHQPKKRSLWQRITEAQFF